MNKNRLKSALFIGVLGLVTPVCAGVPLWTFTPIPGYPPNITVVTNTSAIIKYTITNQSTKSHTLRMIPIQGITASGCEAPLDYKQSCLLSLLVNSAVLNSDVIGGPILCEQANPNQCYQPGSGDSLAIRRAEAPPIQQYKIVSSSGANGVINPSGTQTVSYGTTLNFSATPDEGYVVGQWLVNDNPVQTGRATYQLTNIQAPYHVNVTFVPTALNPSVSILGLSVNCPSSSSSSACVQKNDALSGHERTITITNNASRDATNVAISTSNLPADTSVSPSNCGTIVAGGSCVITVKPGKTASSSVNNVPCTSGTLPTGNINITTDGVLAATVQTYILSYGCIYQGGFIYSVEDNAPYTGSINGKAVALFDTVPGQTSPPTSPPDWGGFGVNIGANLSETNSQGANDGAANSAAIINALTTNHNSPPYNNPSPLSLSDYAAGLCSTLSVDNAGTALCSTAPGPCYTNWYLPAICELASQQFSLQCIGGNTNIQQQVYEKIANTGIVDGAPYSSSTQYNDVPAFQIWAQYFESNGNSNVNILGKGTRLGVRCSRSLTP